jgi:LuxR family maltose regulon positive regulatory protein
VAVLGTKLHVPATRRPLVARPRLTELVRSGASELPRLVLVSAPAGFGKTTLLSQWLAPTRPGGQAQRVAWLSLDERDNDLRRLLTHLVGALESSGLEVGAQTTARLESAHELSTETILTDLVNDVDLMAEETVVALDDYHVIDNAAVHEATSFLLEHLLRHVGLAIATRADPPLPLARLRATADLVEVRAADLRFTPGEAETFFNELMGLDLSPDDILALDARTEGWPAGLQLAALSMRGRDDPSGFIDAFAGSHRFVLDYLVEEVLRRQSDRVADFLMATAVLDQMTGSLCDALTGSDDGGAMLEELERSNLFVVPLDDQRTWYRYHHLFAEALRARLVDEHPGRALALHGTASQWYADHGMLENAVQHALAGRRFGRAADLVEAALPELRRRRHNRVLRSFLVALPESEVRTRPVLSTSMAWTRLLAGDPDGVEGWLGDAERALEALPRDARMADDELRTLPAWISIYRAAAAQGRDDVTGTAAHARHALELAGPEDHLARAGAAGFLGLSAWGAGDLETAVETYSETVRSLHAAGYIADELGSTVVHAQMWMIRGQPRMARRLYERALRTAQQDPGAASTILGDLHVGFSEVLLEQGDLEPAAHHLQTSKELGEGASFLENRHRWYVAMAGLRGAQGHHQTAVELLDQAESMYLRGFFPDVRPIPAMRALIHIGQGLLDEAWDWAGEHQVTAVTEPTYLNEFNLLTLARLLVATARSEGGSTEVPGMVPTLVRLLEEAEAGGRVRSVVEILVTRALVLESLHNRAEALDSLARALTAGVPAGLLRPFLDAGEPLQSLLGEVGRRPATRDHVQVLRAAGSAATVMPTTTDGPGQGTLSDRELEVLRLLATPLSGPQIARQLFVSINTLRTHTKRIFIKLDVNTRAAAVSRAADLGLLQAS